MPEAPKHIQSALEEAATLQSRIAALCMKHVTDPQDGQLTTIAVCLGQMAHTLRSALNQSMWDFATNEILQSADKREAEKLRWSHDFPIATKEEDFEESKSRVMQHITDSSYPSMRQLIERGGRCGLHCQLRTSYPSMRQLIERAQPYHNGNEWLGQLRTLSNDVSHTIPVEAVAWAGHDVSFVGAKPRISGGSVIIPAGKHVAIVYRPVPIYVRELGVFASQDEKWILFLIDFDRRRKPSLIPFTEQAVDGVEQLVARFYKSWQACPGSV